MKNWKKILQRTTAITLMLGMMLSLVWIPVQLTNAASSIKVITPVASGKKVESNSVMKIDYSNVNKGYVMAKYTASTKKTVKAQVVGENGVVYTYTLTPKKWATFPLSEGDGKYKVTLFRNVSGSSYATVGSVTFNVKMSNKLSPFLMVNHYVNYNKKTKCVVKAQSLCKNVSTEMSKVKKIYNWTIGYFTYDKKKAASVKSGYLPDLDTVYNAKKGICFDYAATMVAMLRSQGIPAKLVIGYAGTAYHAWINVYTKKDGWVTGAIYFDGQSWNLMDPTFASSNNSSDAIMKYIGDGSNYTAKYAY